MSRVYIDEECKMCTSYGKWISSKNLNIDLNAQINLTPEEIELDTLVYEKDGSKYYFSDAVIQSISDIGGVYNFVKIIKIFPRFIRVIGFPVRQDSPLQFHEHHVIAEPDEPDPPRNEPVPG